jgi:hypothetical protein
MKYAIAASLALLVILAACAPAAPKQEIVQETIVQEPVSGAVDTSDIDAVTTQVEEIDSDMGLDDLDELDLQLAELDNLELG